MKKADGVEVSKPKTPNKNDIELVPIVGIGASAGGLDAFKKFFRSVPADTKLTFVLVPHLDPSKKSMLVEILSRHTTIPVTHISDNDKILPGTIFVLPPNRNVTIESGRFKLHQIEKREPINLPIDIFFQSLAKSHHEKAVAIVFSGTMRDGSSGIKAIKQDGGLVITQPPQSAEYSAMPRHAIETGAVDLILDIDDMPDAILKYVSHSYISGNLSLKNLDDVDQILAIVKAESNYDFRFYKKNTLIRRILRRMGLKSVEDMRDYVEFLKKDQTERQLLFNDLLIGVTEFFRDEDVWKSLKSDFLKQSVNNLSEDTPFRVWVPACSTGEEAYTIAILLCELFYEADKPYNAQIFATDIDEAAISKARSGVFPESLAEKLPEKLVTKYFVHEGPNYRVVRKIRDSVVFAVQNLVSDAPLSELDFISCRNLLIYLEPDTQKYIIELFSFSLKPGGYLLLGSSESIGFKHECFQMVSKRLRIFKVSETTNARARRKSSLILGKRLLHHRSSFENRHSSQKRNLEDVMRSQLLRKFAPASVIINQRSQILYFYGATEKYMNLPQNEPNFDLPSMVKEGLKNRLRSAIHKVVKDKSEIVLGGMNIDRNGQIFAVNFSVCPISENNFPEGLMLVTFSDDPSVNLGTDTSAKNTVTEEALAKQLEQELIDTKEDLQNTIEELETSNEELKASNEEMMSMNEELQSTNEELETSEEELQSLNAELASVNSQLREKVIALEEANSDIVNLINSIEVATVFLHKDSTIRRFTPTAKRLFNLIPSDIGRPICDLKSPLKDEKLAQKISQVIESLHTDSMEIESEDGKHYLRKIIPFRTEDDRIDGTVLTFVDVTNIKDKELALKASEEKYRESNQLLSAILSHTHVMTVCLDTKFNFIWVNKAYARSCKKSVDFFPGKNHFELYPNDVNRAIFQQVVDTKKPFSIEAKAFVFPDQPERGLAFLDWSLIPVKDEKGAVSSLVLTLADVTSRVLAEKAFKKETMKRNQILESISAGFFSLNDKLEFEYFNHAAEKILGKKAREVINRYIFEVFPQGKGSIFEEYYTKALATKEKLSFETFFEGIPYQNWYSVQIYPFSEGISVYFSVITEQKETELKAERQAKLLAEAQKIAQIGSWVLDLKKNEMLWSDSLYRIFGLSKEDFSGDLFQVIKNSIHPEDREAVEKKCFRPIENHTQQNLEFKIITTGGEIRTLWAEAGQMESGRNGEVSQISGTIHDITEIKKLEQERIKLEQFASRNHKLDALGTLAGGIAHNFNNFLCGIFGNIELATIEKVPKKANKYLENALGCMDAARSLTKQLITFSRGGEPEKAVGPIMPAIIDATNFSLAGSNIKLKLEEMKALWNCYFDKGMLSQVFNNLVINSRQAMPDGGEITISARNVTIANENDLDLPEGKYLEIIFSDNGPGISENDLPHIFDPFFSTKEGNQGLGLAISFSIITRHKGIITVESSPLKGTTFHIYLPADFEVPPSQVTSVKPSGKDKQIVESGKILVMDDEDVIRELLEEMLGSMGFEVSCVNDGRQAIEEVLRHRGIYKAIILDLTVPGRMGGKETCNILRNSGIKVPIFAASGYSSDPVITNPAAFGFDGSLAKPFSLSELSDKFEKLPLETRY